jgi:acyl-CoA synthetase (NDP forming)
VRIFQQQWQRLTDMNVAHDGVIIATMQRGRHEMMVGARIDPVFGPLVIVGNGGSYVETLPDYALLLPPFDRDDVRRALAKLRIAPLLDGCAGGPALDIDALADIAITAGRLIHAAGGHIASLDLNPVLLGAAGEGVIVVDGLIERS